MGLFDRKKKENDISIPEPPKLVQPAFPEPPATASQELGVIKERVETKNDEIEQLESQIENATLKENELPKSIRSQMREPKREISAVAANISPVLYIKLSEYKGVIQATSNMRKDVEKIKSIVSELRNIEKDEQSKLEKSEELIKDINKVVDLFEKTMVAPSE